MAMKALRLTGDKMEQTWSLLGEEARLYDDNGSEPDGNTWLPSDEIDPQAARRVVEAGLGEIVQAARFDANNLHGMARSLGIGAALAAAERTGDWDPFHAAVIGKNVEYTHYGAYGTSDEVWIVRL
jgi:hypothetical protein